MQNQHNDQNSDSPRQIDRLIHASWIIPVCPRGRVLENCAIAIDGEFILDIGLASELKTRFVPKEELDLTGHALIPGLINAHGHSAMSLLRGYADDKPLMDWLENHIWPAERTWVSDEFVRDGSTLAMAEMLASGTTCFSDMYFYPEDTAAVSLEVGMRTQIAFPVLDFPTVWASDADEYLRKGIALHDQYRAHELVNVVFGPHAPYTVSDDPLRRIATYAEELQAPVQIHLHETEFEIQTSMEQFGMRPTQRLADLGLLTPLTQCVHMTQINDQDIELLTQSGAHVVHCPESNLKLASGLCPVDRLQKHGVNVCLGTDSAASNNDLDLFSEMKTAALVGKLAADNAAALDASAALEMATINGAKALGMENLIGSLEAGKKADIVAIDLSGIAHQPMHDPISQIVYTNAGHCVSNVWVNGKHLVNNGSLTTIDTDALKHKTHMWQEKVARK
ncbi:MAG: TRZ/ATZ family hydrolase [Agarilytica sp.]